MDNYHFILEKGSLEVYPEGNLERTVWNLGEVDISTLPKYERSFSDRIFGRKYGYFRDSEEVEGYFNRMVAASHVMNKGDKIYLVEGDISLEFSINSRDIKITDETLTKYNPLREIFFLASDEIKEEVKINNNLFFLDYVGWSLAKKIDFSDFEQLDKPNRIYYELNKK